MKGNDAFDQLGYKGTRYLVDIHDPMGYPWIICNLDGKRRSFNHYCHDNCLGYTGCTNCKEKAGDGHYVMCKFPPKNPI